MEIFYTKNGEREGPVDIDTLMEMIERGELSDRDYYWHEGMSDWKPLSEMSGEGMTSSRPKPPARQVPLYGSKAEYGSDPRSGGLDDSPLAPRLTRLGAYLIDMLAFFISILPGTAVAAFGHMTENERNTAIGILLAVAGGLTMAIYQIYLITTRGQSIGKRMLNIQIVMMDGSDCGFVNGWLLRYFVMGLIGSIPIVGPFIQILDPLLIFREDQRCIHDLIAGTKVIAL